MTRRLRLVAGKDFGDAVREWQLHFAGGLFLLVGFGLGYLAGASRSGSPSLAAAVVPTYLFLGAATVVSVSHDAVAGKRADGELTVLLGLPLSRAEVVFGTLLGRFAVVGSATLLGVLGAVVVGVARGAAVDPVALALGTVAVLVATLAFASVAVAVSTAASSVTVSSTAAFGIFALFVFRLWEFLPALVDLALVRFAGTGLPAWVGRAAANVAPFAAVRNVVAPISERVAAGFSTFAAPLATGATPLVQRPAVAALVVAVWLSVPIGLAYWRFSRIDV